VSESEAQNGVSESEAQNGAQELLPAILGGLSTNSGTEPYFFRARPRFFRAPSPNS